MGARIYARYSTDRQSESSIHDQLRVCRECASARGWAVAREYLDEGISGAAQGNRPGWLAVLSDLVAGDVLLVTDTTRLSRSQELAPLIERLRFRGIRVIGVLDGFDSDSPQARMQAGLSGLMSDEMRASIRVRTHSALQMRALSRRPTGGRVYGFAAAGEPAPEAAIVREIFQRVADGEPLRSIAADLNVRGIPSPGATWAREKRRTDGRWLVSTLHAIVRNERYIGVWRWNTSQWHKDPDSGVRVRRERPRDQWVEHEGVALIERSVWDRVQARATERARVFGGSKGARPRYLLSGILTCRHCGGRLIVTGSGGSHYYCATHRHGGDAACSMSVGVRRQVAEDVILREVREGLLSPEAEALAADLIGQWARQDRVRVSDATPDLDREIAEIEALIAERPALAGALRQALEGLHERRTVARRSAWRRASEPTGDALTAYRAAVTDMRARLASAGQPAREALRELLGGDVEVWPAEHGRHLIAAVGLDARPLIGGISDGSGGALWTRAVYKVALVA